MDHSGFQFRQGLHDSLYTATDFITAIPSAKNPAAKRFAFHCDRARIEIELKPYPSSGHCKDSQAHSDACQVSSIRVYILPKYDDNNPTVQVNALGYFNFELKPKTAIAKKLADLSLKHILQVQVLTSSESRREANETFLQHLASCTGNLPKNPWSLTPNPSLAIDHPSTIDPFKIDQDRYMLNVIPTFQVFVKQRDSAESTFTSFKKTKNGCCTIIASIDVSRKLIALERYLGLREELKTTKVYYTLYDHLNNPDGWLQEIEEQVYKRTETDSAKQDFENRQTYNVLLKILFEFMMTFKCEGHRFVDELLPQDTEQEDAVDSLIISGDVDLNRNRLQGKSHTGSLIQLEIGRCVARASITCRENSDSSAIAWYLNEKNGFRLGSRKVLTTFWRACEKLKSPSQAMVLRGVRILKNIATPSCRAPERLDDLLGHEVLGVKGLTFRAEPLESDISIARAAQGIEQIEIKHTQTRRSMKHPQNFYLMNVQIRHDNSLDLTLVNKMDGTLSAFISSEDCLNAGGYQEVLKQVCVHLAQWRSPMRVTLHKQIEQLASGPDSWVSTTPLSDFKPKSNGPLPPSHVLDLNIAYENTAFLVRELCRRDFQTLDALRIHYIQSTTDSGWICRLDISQNKSPWLIKLFVDRVGIKQVDIYRRPPDGPSRFIRPPNGVGKIPKVKLQQLCSRLLKTVAYARLSSRGITVEEVHQPLEEYLGTLFYRAVTNDN